MTSSQNTPIPAPPDRPPIYFPGAVWTIERSVGQEGLVLVRNLLILVEAVVLPLAIYFYFFGDPTYGIVGAIFIVLSLFAILPFLSVVMDRIKQGRLYNLCATTDLGAVNRLDTQEADRFLQDYLGYRHLAYVHKEELTRKEFDVQALSMNILVIFDPRGVQIIKIGLHDRTHEDTVTELTKALTEHFNFKVRLD